LVYVVEDLDRVEIDLGTFSKVVLHMEGNQ
jgi:hypothetical protein